MKAGDRGHYSRGNKPALENIGVSTYQVLKAEAHRVYNEGLGLEGYYYKFFGTGISEEEFNQNYRSSGLQYNVDLTRELVDYLIEKKANMEIYEYIIKCGRGGWQEKVGKAAVGTVAGNITLSTLIIFGLILIIRANAKYCYDILHKSAAKVQNIFYKGKIFLRKLLNQINMSILLTLVCVWIIIKIITEIWAYIRY